MAVEVAWAQTVDVIETLATNIPASANPVVNHNGYSSDGTMDSSTTPPATLLSADEIPLSGGAYTIDLTALVGTNGLAVDFTGLKVQLFKIKNKAGNAAMTVSFGAANPYNLFGASWTIILLAEQEFLFYGNDAAPDVSGSASDIDVAGTGTEIFELITVAG